MSGKPHLVHIVGFYKGQNIDLQCMLVLKDTLYLSDNQWYIIQRHNLVHYYSLLDLNMFANNVHPWSIPHRIHNQILLDMI